MTTLTSVTARDKLKVQREPHWMKLNSGAYLGFRKMTAGSTGAWLARYRTDDGRQLKLALGEFADSPPSQRFDLAKRAAEQWFAHLDRGGISSAKTVADACRGYVEHVRQRRSDKPATDLEARYRRWVNGDPFGKIELAKLTRQRVSDWRSRLRKAPVKVNRDKREKPLLRERSASSVNRDVTAVRAALNFAHDAAWVTTDVAWRVELRPEKNADRRRDVYLDITQRQALIEAAQPDLRDLIRGLSLIPLRPGALAALTVSHFDQRRSVLTVGKDKAGGDRRIKLPPTTAEWLLELCGGRPSGSPLIPRGDGLPWNKDAWKGPMKRADMDASLPPAATAYALRHSVITDLVTGGLDLLTVAQLSGTSVAMIERHYGHLRAEHAAAALARLAL